MKKHLYHYISELCSHSLLSGSIDPEVHFGTSLCNHVDESVDRELLNLAVYQIGDARLTYPEKIRGFFLGQPVLFYIAAQTDHQICPDLKILSHVILEAKIFEDVSAAFGVLRFGVRASEVRIWVLPLHFTL